jgi:hypothetical protein
MSSKDILVRLHSTYWLVENKLKISLKVTAKNPDVILRLRVPVDDVENPSDSNSNSDSDG